MHCLLRRRLGLVVITGLIGGLLLAACGSSSSSSSGSVSRASAGHRQYTIALVTGDDHDPYYVTMNDGAQAMAAKLGVKVIWQGPQTFEAAPQISILDSVLASKPDFLLVAPTDSRALVGPLEQFDSHHVPVITVDTDVDTKSVRLGNISSNNVLGGELAAKYLARTSSVVAYIGEQRGVLTTDDRLAGFEEELKKYPSVKYAGPQFGADDPNTATQIASALLSRYPNLTGIFASDDPYADGAAVAVEDAGKVGKVKIVAFDAEPDEVASLKRGVIQALIAQRPYLMGELAVKYALDYLKTGAKPPAATTPGYEVITKANVNSPAAATFLYRPKG